MGGFVNPDKSYQAPADRVFTLYQRIADVRDRHSSHDTDARRVNLNVIAMAANAATAILRLMSFATQGGEPLLCNALGLTKPEYITFVTDDMLRSSKLFLLLEGQFQIEALFSNILITLGSPVTKRGYYNIVDKMLGAAGIADRSTKLRTMMVAAHMRNSMHANGIHHNDSMVEVIDNVEFRFEQGKPVHCGHWVHVVTALSASITIVDEVLAANVVQSIQHIPDDYAAQTAKAIGT